MAAILARGLGHQKRRRLIGRQERDLPRFSSLFRVSPPFLSSLFSFSLSVSRSFLGSIHSCSRNSKFPLLVYPRLSTPRRNQTVEARWTLPSCLSPRSLLKFQLFPLGYVASPSPPSPLPASTHRRQMQFFPSFLFLLLLLLLHCRVTHPQPSECYVSETVPRAPSCLCFYRCFPPRSLSVAHRARTGKFFKLLCRNFQPTTLSLFLSLERWKRKEKGNRGMEREKSCNEAFEDA